MTDSQVWHSGAGSMAGTGAPVAWNSDKMKNSKASTGKLVIQTHVTDIDLEATEEYNILSAASISFKNESLRDCEQHYIVLQGMRWKDMANILLFEKDS